MKKRQFKFRAWLLMDKIMRETRRVTFDEMGNAMTVGVCSKDVVVTYGPGSFELMAFTGLFDDTNKSIYEEDLIDFFIENQRSQILPARGKVVWNEKTSHGEYGYVIIDQYGGIHSFNNPKGPIKVVGNSFEGVIK